MNFLPFSFFLAFFLLLSCTDDIGTKGSITLSITDSPTDATDVKGVNIFVTSVECRVGTQWKTIRNFELPVGMNLLEYAGGTSFTVVDQFLDPAQFNAMRFNLNLADPKGGVLQNPQCNIEFADGSTKPIYGATGVKGLTVIAPVTLNSHAHIDYTLDVDVRKSIIIDSAGRYLFRPVIRFFTTASTGHVVAHVIHYQSTDRMVVFGYPAGQFHSSEAETPANGMVRFSQAITSGRIANNSFALGFLPGGTYDLVFVRQNERGEFVSVAGQFNGVIVSAAKTLDLTVDLNVLTGS